MLVPFFLFFCLLFIFEKNHHLLRIFVSADEWKSTWSLEMTVFTLGSKLVVSWICNMITHAVLVFCLLVCLRFTLLLVQSWILEDGLKFSTVRLCKVWKYLFLLSPQFITKPSWEHSSLVFVRGCTPRFVYGAWDVSECRSWVMDWSRHSIASEEVTDFFFFFAMITLRLWVSVMHLS